MARSFGAFCWIFEVIEQLVLREGPAREVRKIMHREREREVSAR